MFKIWLKKKVTFDRNPSMLRAEFSHSQTPTHPCCWPCLVNWNICHLNHSGGYLASKYLRQNEHMVFLSCGWNWKFLVGFDLNIVAMVVEWCLFFHQTSQVFNVGLQQHLNSAWCLKQGHQTKFSKITSANGMVRLKRSQMSIILT